MAPGLEDMDRRPLRCPAGSPRESRAAQLHTERREGGGEIRCGLNS